MNYKKHNICAIVPVRAGSKRVVNKNIRSFAGANLLQRKIDQLKFINFKFTTYKISKMSDVDESQSQKSQSKKSSKKPSR